MLPEPPLSVFQFGDFRLDCGRFELRLNGQPLRVERKPMELLILLASRQGQLVTRAEIAQRLWSSEVFVDTEHGINTAVRKLRYLLRDDSGDPRFIQTVTGMGYRFVAPLDEIPIPSPAPPAEAAPDSPPLAKKRSWGWYVAAALGLLLALGGLAAWQHLRHPSRLVYTQLTDFTDSAVAPALSPDGRMMAFIRGNGSFLTTDQIYVKLLPDGEPRRVTDDPRPKYGLAFSPDGSQIAYTVFDGSAFSTFEVSALGGEPRLLLRNAAGLVWLDSRHLLFSRIRSGIHMGVVTASETGAGLREIYFPAHERGMAHFAFPSPDRRWALVVEMNGNGDWAPCRLVALDSQSPSRQVGPDGACNSAGWSPDGRWMYFTAWVRGPSHLWRQRFPDGPAEQVTSGPTDEQGVAVAPRGRSLITSVGVEQSALWIHDRSGDRPLSSEGEVAEDLSPPVFSADAAVVYYLLRREQDSGAELWRTQVASGQSDPVFPGVAITAFDLSPDDRQAVYTTAAPDGTTQLWLAPLDRSAPPRPLGVSGALSPHFGLPGRILFQRAEGNRNYLEQIRWDGSHRSRVLPYPIEEFQSVSPGRHWVVAAVPPTPSVADLPTVVAIPLAGGPARRLCPGYCVARWSASDSFLLLPVEQPSRTTPGQSLAIPLGPDEALPGLPLEKLATPSPAGVLRGARRVPRAYVIPGNDPAQYAWINTTVHRNLYRITLP